MIINRFEKINLIIHGLGNDHNNFPLLKVNIRLSNEIIDVILGIMLNA